MRYDRAEGPIDGGFSIERRPAWLDVFEVRRPGLDLVGHVPARFFVEIAGVGRYKGSRDNTSTTPMFGQTK